PHSTLYFSLIFTSDCNKYTNTGIFLLHCISLHIEYFLFFIIRRESSFTLFPYTTLFRSARCGNVCYNKKCEMNHKQAPLCLIARSEEHTSELQSRFDLVCRLLLEKKKVKSIF